MTRFEKEWSGMLGPMWQKNAHAEAERLLRQRDNIEVEPDGAARWKSSGSYLPDDVCEKLEFAGADWFPRLATGVKRDEQNRKALERYRANHRTTQEELVEMKAAHGKGSTVVNILTGEVIRF